jgi:hypothetical protein
MSMKHARRGLVAALTVALCGLGAAPAAAAQAAAAPAPPATGGSPATLPDSAPRATDLPLLGGPNQNPAQPDVASALAQAKTSGQPAAIPALTTPTSSATVSPAGVVTSTSFALPLRVHRGGRWVPVSTRLHASGGRLVPAALPGDAVSFSDGGTGPMAVISAGGSQVSLSWPGALPVPSVSGAAATYANVLPGVSLVLTATTGAAGGFREVLVIQDAAAASRLAGLRLREAGAPLRPALAGGLAAPFDGGQAAFVAPPPMMWDSSAQQPGTAAARSAATAAKAVGAGLAESGPATASSVAAPAGGARLARLTASLAGGGREISVAPDTKMLASPTTRWPVYFDPDFTVQGNRSGYDPVQSESGCTGSHFNSSSYPFSPVGFDNFQDGSCQDNDTDYALYQIAIPKQGSGSGAGTSVLAGTANLLSASFQLAEAYTSSCSASPTVTVSWIGGLSKSTGWPGPAPEKGETDATAAMGPDPGSCNTVENTGKTVAQGFNELPNLNKLSNSAATITLRVWEKGDTNDVDHKQLTDNPDIQVTYIDTPNVPADLEAAASSAGSGGVACDTTNPGTNGSAAGLPHIGKTDSTNGPFLVGTFTTGDTNSVTGSIKYWNNATPSTTTTIKTATGTGRLSAEIPASFTSGLANGTVLGYQAQASDSFGGKTYTSAFSKPCYFAVDPTSPDPPTATTSFNQATNQPVGTVLTFTVTQSAGDTATSFVWDLDQQPPTTSPPAAMTCTASSTTCPLKSGSAAISVTVPAPGPHILWLYETDTAGNESGWTSLGSPGSSATFTGSADAPVSYTAGASLAANFAAARGAGQPYDNTIISTQAGQSGNANGDGGHRSFDEALLTSAGWAPGKAVTVDGASFTLPSFGTSASGPDNLLAANQTIGTGTGGAQGSALVFLATSTTSHVQVPGTVTGAPDAGVVRADVTVPGVAGGTAVSGQGCTGAVSFDPTLSGCEPAQGFITYASGCSAGSQASFLLTVPDWSDGPADLAAVVNADRDVSGSQQAVAAKIFALAVPVDPQCTVTSVSLPDVGNAVQETGNTSSLSLEEQGLHVFGMALRNTTASTPEAAGSPAAASSGQAWSAAAESAAEDDFGPPSGTTWGNQTIRVAMATNISAPAGAQVRIRLSDPGFLSTTSGGPLHVGAASIAPSSFNGTANAAQTPVPLSFSSAASVAVPEGGDIYSDPLTLPFAVTAGQELLVSLYLTNSAITELPENSLAGGGETWWASPATPNETGSASGSPFTGSGSQIAGATTLVTGIDVTTPQVTLSGVTSPGTPTVIVANDNVIGGTGSAAFSDTLNVPSQRLAGQLVSQGAASGFAPVDAGIESNQLLADGTTAGGVSLLARLDRDVLAEPDVGTVIIDEGLSDLLGSSGVTADQVTDALSALDTQLSAFGVNVIVGSLTPCSGSGGKACSSAADTARTSANQLIDGGIGFACTADFDVVVTNGGSPEDLATSPANLDSGDHVNLSPAGYAALPGALAAGGCALSPDSPQ